MKQSPATMIGAALIIPLTCFGFIAVLVSIIAISESGLETQQQHATATADTVHAEQAQIRRDILATQAAAVSFARDVQPILESRCVYCHGPESIAGAPPNGLELDTYANVMRGSMFLPVVVPGEPQNSSIILLLRSGGMPAQSEPLPPEQIELISDWIEQGAPDN